MTTQVFQLYQQDEDGQIIFFSFRLRPNETLLSEFLSFRPSLFVLGVIAGICGSLQEFMSYTCWLGLLLK